ncbi:MAG: decarboxylating NADP(+)-dependent phosphogluconate dehydrogenase [Bulleidia sp.]|nr:decarboxylating NADP(+)-dependent phosphogluconate dehydrogenase [Bulleidia sp.]
MNDIGLYGLGVMGQSLVLNMAGKGYHAAAFNKFDYEKTTLPFIVKRAGSLPVTGYRTVEEFVSSLARPRKIMLMVTAGKAVDSIIEELIPFLEEGDMIADCGNSYYKDTIRREKHLAEKGIHFFGIGVSGGEKGALEGPSIMPGGNKAFYEESFGNILEAMSARAEDGEPCCAYIGPDGAGHYVKMVHNGIEYSDIQNICEAYFLMKELLGMGNEEMADVFASWNEGRLNSYLIDITSKILRKKDENGNYIVDLILDEAGQKGTGKWASMEALDMGVAAPSVVESVLARCLSAMKQERLAASSVFPNEKIVDVRDKEQFLKDLECAVYASKIVSYAQGFALMKEASEEHDWNLDYGRIAMIWRNGCIIRAQFLSRIKDAFEEESLSNMMVSKEFIENLKECEPGWRRTAASAIAHGIYSPVIVNSLLYFDGYRSPQLPANLLQAQRDWFGAHTYHRADKPYEESFHTQWEE